MGSCCDFVPKPKVVFWRICKFAPLSNTLNFQGKIAIDDQSRLRAEFDPSDEMQGDFIMFIQRIHLVEVGETTTE